MKKVSKVKFKQQMGRSIVHYYAVIDEVCEKMEESVRKKRVYEKEWKGTFRDRVNLKRRERYADDEGFRLRERERVRKATKPWAELSEKTKERKRKWQREFQRKKYHSDSEFREKKRESSRKSGGSFLSFGGYSSGKAGNSKKAKAKKKVKG